MFNWFICGGIGDACSFLRLDGKGAVGGSSYRKNPQRAVRNLTCMSGAAWAGRRGRHATNRGPEEETAHMEYRWLKNGVRHRL